MCYLKMVKPQSAAEPPKAEPTPDLDKLVDQAVDLAPWAYAWRADREVQEKPEAYFIPLETSNSLLAEAQRARRRGGTAK